MGKEKVLESETVLKVVDYLHFDYPVFRYLCKNAELSIKYIDTLDNFKYCPFCGRLIKEIEE